MLTIGTDLILGLTSVREKWMQKSGLLFIQVVSKVWMLADCTFIQIPLLPFLIFIFPCVYRYSAFLIYCNLSNLVIFMPFMIPNETGTCGCGI